MSPFPLMFQRGFGVLESFTLRLYLSVHEPDPGADTKASHKGRNGREIDAVFLIHSNYACVKRRGTHTSPCARRCQRGARHWIPYS